jgi:hypothetical protein
VFANHDVNRWTGAATAFSRMDSNAVPFLVKQLRYDQSGTIERLELRARTVPLLSKVAMQLVIPSAKRSYAAVGLKYLGTNAVSALEPMVAALQCEPQADVRINLVAAMGRIVGIRFSEGSNPGEWQTFERAVLERVRRQQPTPQKR